jgi:hypothetical protein
MPELKNGYEVFNDPVWIVSLNGIISDAFMGFTGLVADSISTNNEYSQSIYKNLTERYGLSPKEKKLFAKTHPDWVEENGNAKKFADSGWILIKFLIRNTIPQHIIMQGVIHTPEFLTGIGAEAANTLNQNLESASEFFSHRENVQNVINGVMEGAWFSGKVGVGAVGLNLAGKALNRGFNALGRGAASVGSGATSLGGRLVEMGKGAGNKLKGMYDSGMSSLGKIKDAGTEFKEKHIDPALEASWNAINKVIKGANEAKESARETAINTLGWTQRALEGTIESTGGRTEIGTGTVTLEELRAAPLNKDLKGFLEAKLNPKEGKAKAYKLSDIFTDLLLIAMNHYDGDEFSTQLDANKAGDALTWFHGDGKGDLFDMLNFLTKDLPDRETAKAAVINGLGLAVDTYNRLYQRHSQSQDKSNTQMYKEYSRVQSYFRLGYYPSESKPRPNLS